MGIAGEPGSSFQFDRLDAVDVLLHRSEKNPRLRSGVIAIEILDTTPSWDRYLARFDDLSCQAARLRQSVITPTLPTTAPRWVTDADFDLAFHVRRIRAPEPASVRTVFDLAEVMIQSPIDLARPLWSATLVEGLTGGQAASVVHFSHALADGLGGIELFGALYDSERDPPNSRETVPPPLPGTLSPNELAVQGLSELPADVVGRVRNGLRSLGGALRNPDAALSGAVAYARSSARILAPVAQPSPVLRGRSLRSASDAVDISLPDLKAAASAAGASVNDAYLAGLCGTLRLYHERLGCPVDVVPIAVPVSLRSHSDVAGGNRFAGATIEAPVGITDARERMRHIGLQMARRRGEPAIGVAEKITPWLNLLPDSLLEPLAGCLVTSDVQASNVPVYPGDTYLAGAKVVRQYGVGPLPGVAMMAVLVSRSGWCTVNVRYDLAAVSDVSLLRVCLVEAFDEVLAVGGTGKCRPATFSVNSDATRA